MRLVFSRNCVEELLSEILCTFSGVFVVCAEFSYFGYDAYFWGDALLSNEVQKFIADRVPICFYVHFNEIPKKEEILERVKCTVKNGECVCVWNYEEVKEIGSRDGNNGRQ